MTPVVKLSKHRNKSLKELFFHLSTSWWQFDSSISNLFDMEERYS